MTTGTPWLFIDDVAVVDLERAVEGGLDARLLRTALRRAADVEGTHGELRARLADRLRGDDADRLADVDRRAAGEIAPIALAADAVLGLAGQHRADQQLLDAGLVDLLDAVFVDQLAGLDDERCRSADRRCRRAPSGRGCAR